MGNKVPILNVKDADGTWHTIPALTGPKGADGKQGKDGNPGVALQASQPSDPSIRVWIDSDGTADDIATTQYVDDAVAPKANKSEIPDISGKADKSQLGDQLLCSLSGTTLTITRKV